MGQPKEVILPAQLPPDTVLICLPIPLNIRGQYPSCEWRRNLHRMTANRADEAGAIPAHALLPQRLPEGRKAQGEVQQSVTLNTEQREGQSCFFLARDNRGNWQPIWPGIRQLSGV